MTIDLRSAGTVTTSTIVTLGFVAVAVIVLTKEGPSSNAGLLILGAFIAKFSTVVDYWMGNSSNAKAKDETIAGKDALISNLAQTNAQAPGALPQQ